MRTRTKHIQLVGLVAVGNPVKFATFGAYGIKHAHIQVRVVTRSFHPAWGDRSPHGIVATFQQDEGIIANSMRNLPAVKILLEEGSSTTDSSGRVTYRDAQGRLKGTKK